MSGSATPTTLAGRLAAAQIAYHKLLTGQLGQVFVDQNGEQLRFTQANKDDLYGYIQQLQSQIANPDLIAQKRLVGPLRFLF